MVSSANKGMIRFIAERIEDINVKSKTKKGKDRLERNTK
jgi:hypothetical protein